MKKDNNLEVKTELKKKINKVLRKYLKCGEAYYSLYEQENAPKELTPIIEKVKQHLNNHSLIKQASLICDEQINSLKFSKTKIDNLFKNVEIFNMSVDVLNEFITQYNNIVDKENAKWFFSFFKDLIGPELINNFLFSKNNSYVNGVKSTITSMIFQYCISSTSKQLNYEQEGYIDSTVSFESILASLALIYKYINLYNFIHKKPKINLTQTNYIKCIDNIRNEINYLCDLENQNKINNNFFKQNTSKTKCFEKYLNKLSTDFNFINANLFKKKTIDLLKTLYNK